MLQKTLKLKCFLDDLIDPITEFWNIGVDQIVVQVTDRLIFPKDFSFLSDSRRNDSNKFPQFIVFQNHPAARVAWKINWNFVKRIKNENISAIKQQKISETLDASKLTIASASFSISRSSTEWSVRHDFCQFWIGVIITKRLIDQWNIGMAQFWNSFQFFSKAPAINFPISSSKTLDRIRRGVQTNMVNFIWKFQRLFEDCNRDVGCVTIVFWIPIWMNNELGNFSFRRVIILIVIVFEIKVRFYSKPGPRLLFVLQAVGGE